MTEDSGITKLVTQAIPIGLRCPSRRTTNKHSHAGHHWENPGTQEWDQSNPCSRHQDRPHQKCWEELLHADCTAPSPGWCGSRRRACPQPGAPQQKREPRAHTQLPLWVPSWEPDPGCAPQGLQGNRKDLTPGHLTVMRSGERPAATSRVSPPCSVQGVVPTSAAALFICRAEVGPVWSGKPAGHRLACVGFSNEELGHPWRLVCPGPGRGAESWPSLLSGAPSPSESPIRDT